MSQLPFIFLCGFLAAACEGSGTRAPADLAWSFDFARADGTVVPTSVSVSGKLIDIAVGPSAGAAGVKVCRHPEGSPCSTTDMDGLYALEGLPYDQDFAVRMAKAGFLSVVLPLHLKEDRPGLNIALPTASGVDMSAAIAGATRNPQKSILGINIFGKGATSSDGSTVALVPPQGDGPYYYMGIGTSAPLSTSGKSVTPGGILIFNVEPAATVELSFTPPTGTCAVDAAWPATTVNHFKVPTIADTMTVMGVVCG
jgi:hypothetical protein